MYANTISREQAFLEDMRPLMNADVHSRTSNANPLANVIAWPVGYFAMKSWLRSFAYRRVCKENCVMT
jgi:hypothetical protein